MKKLSFMDAMESAGGVMILVVGIFLSGLIYINIGDIDNRELIAVGFFLIGYPISLLAFKRTVNRRIENGEFDNEIDKR